MVKRTRADGDGEQAHVLCCMCGDMIPPNPASMCVTCLKSQVDVTEGVSRQVMLPWCKGCNRYLKPGWTEAELESRQLLGICLGKIKGLQNCKLVDASFIWTEPHSKRLKVKLSLQKEVVAGAIMQQNLVVEFVVQNLQCDDCKKSFTPHTWNAAVQVRQKAPHKRSFFMLEQLILKHDAHDKVLFIKEVPDGVDFFFASRSKAQGFAHFVQSCFPSRTKVARQLVSHDSKSNTYNFKYTLNVEICSVCKDDLVYVPKEVTALHGGVPSLMLCHRVTAGIHLVDSPTQKGMDICSAEYWRRPFQSVCNRRHLTEFIVLDVELCDEDVELTQSKHFSGGRNKFQLADIELARVADLGVNDERVTVRSHMGHCLSVGDHVQGYDLRSVNISGIDTEALTENCPDVILVKRCYKRRHVRERKWVLRHLEMEKHDGNRKGGEQDEADMEEYKRDLEEDAELRKDVQIYRNPKFEEPDIMDEQDQKLIDNIDANTDDEEDSPEIPLAELLGGLSIDDVDRAVKPWHMPMPDDSSDEDPDL